MKFCSGVHPERTYHCPVCRDDWRETLTPSGVVVLRSAPVAATSLALTPRAIAQPIPRREPCGRPHIGPVVGTLAVVGGITLLAALLGSGRRGD